MILLSPLALLLALIPLGVTAYFFLIRRNAKSSRILFYSSAAESFLKRSHQMRWWYRGFFVAFVASLLLLVFAIARPAFVKKWTKQWHEGIDILFALDVSESMDATDFLPNRIEVAKQVLKEFVGRRSFDRIGLVLFGGEAITKVPLTQDYPFLLQQIDSVHLRELKQGTAIGMAIASSVGRLRSSETKTRVIILLTDGDSNVGSINPVTAAHLAKDEGIKIYTIGMGKSRRVVVPIYAYDAFGKKTQLLTQVPSYLNPELLQRVSRLTGAKAYMAKDAESLTKILAEIDELEKSPVKQSAHQEYDEIFLPFAASATLILFLLAGLLQTRFRRARYV